MPFEHCVEDSHVKNADDAARAARHRERAFDPWRMDYPLAPEEAFNAKYRDTTDVAAEERGERCPWLHGLIDMKCCGWRRRPTPAEVMEAFRSDTPNTRVNGHQKPRQSEQMVDHNILGVWSGASSDKGKSGRRARSRRQGREPRESGGGAQRRALTPASTRGTCRSDDAPATTTSCGRHESRIRRFLAVANTRQQAMLSTVISEGTPLDWVMMYHHGVFTWRQFRRAAERTGPWTARTVRRINRFAEIPGTPSEAPAATDVLP